MTRAPDTSCLTGVTTLTRTSLLGQFAGGVGWSLLATSLERGIGLLQTFIVARTLGIEEYGKYGLMFVTVGLVSSVAGLQLGLTASVHLSRHHHGEPARAVAVVRLSELVSLASALALLTVVCAWPELLGSALLGAPNYRSIMLLGGTIAVLGVVSGVQDGALQGLEEFQSLAILRSVAAVVGLLLVLALAKSGDLGSIMVALTLAALLRCAAVAVLKELKLRKVRARPSADGIWSARAVLWSFSLPSLLATLLHSGVNWYGTLAVSGGEAGFEEVAIVTVAQQWRGTVLFVSGVLASVAIPMMARLSQSGDRDGVARLHGHNLRANLVAGVLLTVAVGLRADRYWPCTARTSRGDT